MAKFSVGVLDGFDIDSSVKTVYKGNSVIQAVKVWVAESIDNPTMVAIYASRKADAELFYKNCADNIDRIKELCSQDRFPYKWEYIENGILKERRETSFREHTWGENEYLEDQLYPFALG